MNNFETLLIDTLKSLPEVRAFVARFEQLEAELRSAKPSVGKPPEHTVAIPRKELVKQIGGPLVRSGEASGILRPIVSNGGKGPKKRYPTDQVERLLQTFSTPPNNGRNGKK